MSRVLVTGASGFLGRHAVAALAAGGHDVDAVARRPAGDPDPAGVTWHAADLLGDPRELVGAVRPERLLHLAWYVEPADYLRSPENLAWVGASLRLLRAFAEAGGRRAVLVGTCAEYDWSTGGVLAEDAPIAPATVYGGAKDGLHRAAAAYAREAGVELAWARLFFLYGPGEPEGRLVPAVARALLEGRPAETTAGTAVRDYAYVGDVAGALAAVLDAGLTGPVNVGTGTGVPLRDVIEGVAEACGRPDLLRLGARPERPGDPRELVAGVARLTGEAGFTPAVDLQAGLARTVDWWRSRIAGSC